MCPPACNSGVPVRVCAVRRDVPVSLVPGIVCFIPTGERWEPSGWCIPRMVLFGLSLGMPPLCA
jgi:hypothetical protein